VQEGGGRDRQLLHHPGRDLVGELLSLVFAIARIDNALMGLDQGNALRGSWETLRQPVSSAWSEVTKSFTSGANNLMGKTAADPTDAVAWVSLDPFI
jgi:conjugal transfer mating pair stabilization protein TraN